MYPSCDKFDVFFGTLTYEAILSEIMVLPGRQCADISGKRAFWDLFSAINIRIKPVSLFLSPINIVFIYNFSGLAKIVWFFAGI